MLFIGKRGRGTGWGRKKGIGEKGVGDKGVVEGVGEKGVWRGREGMGGSRRGLRGRNGAELGREFLLKQIFHVN